MKQEQTTVLRVVVASPGDVQKERDSLVDIITAINETTALDRSYRLDLYRWETDVPPSFHVKGPQGVVDSSLRITDCDIVIGLFWKRFGTPVSDAQSGTEHELQIAYEAWKKNGQRPLIMIYFNSEQFFTRSTEEHDQYGRVLEFRKKFAREALFGEYEGIEDFKKKVHKDLTQIVRRLDSHAERPAQAAGSLLSEPPSNEKPSDRWPELRSIPLHTFAGLKQAVRENSVFQHFKIDRRDYTNPSPISYLWADVYRGGTINAAIEESSPPKLCVAFENKPSSWPCNLSLRPIAEQAIISTGMKRLVFDARVTPSKHIDSSLLSEIFMAVRVVNGWLQHWSYGPGPGSYRLFSTAHDWSTLEIDLLSDQWWLFRSDGNHCFGPATPDFSVIAALVIEFGSDAGERPGPGRGEIQIRDVRLI